MGGLESIGGNRRGGGRSNDPPRPRGMGRRPAMGVVRPIGSAGIYLFCDHRKWFRYDFHILNRDASILPIILKLDNKLFPRLLPSLLLPFHANDKKRPKLYMGRRPISSFVAVISPLHWVSFDGKITHARTEVFRSPPPSDHRSCAGTLQLYEYGCVPSDPGRSRGQLLYRGW